MTRPTKLGSTFKLLSGALGYDPDADVGDLPAPIDYAASSNGGYAEYPYVPPTVGLIQSEKNTNSNVDATIAITLAATPTEGNIEIAVLTMRDVGSTGTLSGWTWLDTFSSDIGNGGTGTVWYRVVPAGASATVTVTKIGSHGAGLWVGEFSAGAYETHVTVDTVAASTNLTVGTVDVTDSDSLLVSAFVQAATGAVFTPTGGATEVEQGGMVGGVGPSWLGQYEVAAAGAGQSGTASSDTNQDYGGILILFAPAGSLSWFPAPNAVDGSDATYQAVGTGTNVLRVDLGEAVRIVRAELRIGTENAGSRTYNVYGANEADFSDQMLLDSTTFTGTGSYTAQDVVFNWTTSTAYQYYLLTGTSENRYVYSFELYEASDDLSAYALLTDIITDHGLLTGLADDDHSAYVTVTGGGGETSYALGNLGATETLNLANGNGQYGTLNANCTIGFTGWTNGVLCRFEVELTEDGSGGWTPTFSGVTWLGGTTPTHTTTAGSVTTYVFWSRDGGTTIYGAQVGGSTVTYATPAIVLGTAAATGAASSVIRSDATIVAFDSTVPVTQAYSDVAATGSAAVAARRDHVHGMPAGSTGGHTHVAEEIHLSDGSTTTFTLDGYYEPGSVQAWNRTTIARLLVTEVLPDQVTISAAGTTGDELIFDYAATLA